MSKQKLSRNKQILSSWRKGVSIYELAKKHGLSWPRTKRIIQEQEARETVQ